MASGAVNILDDLSADGSSISSHSSDSHSLQESPDGSPGMRGSKNKNSPYKQSKGLNAYDGDDLGAMLKDLDSKVNKKTLKQLANI
mgnify:CR=1 FL=1